MGNDKCITLVNEKNLIDTIECDILFAFEYNGDKYIVYDKNEKDFDGNTIVYCGKIDVINNKQYIRNIDGESYFKVKEIIKKMINYSGDEYDV